MFLASPIQVERGLKRAWHPQQIDPPRFQQAMNSSSGTHDRFSRRRRRRSSSNIRRSAAVREPCRIRRPSVGSDGCGEKAAAEANQALITYLEDHGVPKEQRLNMVMNNPVLQNR